MASLLNRSAPNGLPLLIDSLQELPCVPLGQLARVSTQQDEPGPHVPATCTVVRRGTACPASFEHIGGLLFVVATNQSARFFDAIERLKT